MLDDLKKRLRANDISAEFTDMTIEKISDAGFDQVYGARPLRRAIQSQIEDLISEKIIDGEISSGQSITIDVKDNEFVVE